MCLGEWEGTSRGESAGMSKRERLIPGERSEAEVEA